MRLIFGRNQSQQVDLIEYDSLRTTYNDIFSLSFAISVVVGGTYLFYGQILNWGDFSSLLDWLKTSSLHFIGKPEESSSGMMVTVLGVAVPLFSGTFGRFLDPASYNETTIILKRHLVRLMLFIASLIPLSLPVLIIETHYGMISITLLILYMGILAVMLHVCALAIAVSGRPVADKLSRERANFAALKNDLRAVPTEFRFSIRGISVCHILVVSLHIVYCLAAYGLTLRGPFLVVIVTGSIVTVIGPYMGYAYLGQVRVLRLLMSLVVLSILFGAWSSMVLLSEGSVLLLSTVFHTIVVLYYSYTSLRHQFRNSHIKLRPTLDGIGLYYGRQRLERRMDLIANEIARLEALVTHPGSSGPRRYRSLLSKLRWPGFSS